MILNLKHKQLVIYTATQKLVIECYKLVQQLPTDEKFGMVSQIRRAAISVHLNIAEGISRSSILERKRFYEIARSSLIEIDAALDISRAVGYLENFNLEELSIQMILCFKLLTGLINSCNRV